MTRRIDCSPNELFPSLGFGLGLRHQHYDDVLSGRSSASWFEVVTENYLGDGGRPIRMLEKIREDYPIVFHGVSLSIGSVDPLNLTYLKRLKSLEGRIQPEMVSDHLCWTGIQGENLHDLMPLPFTSETVAHVVERVKQVQDILNRRILLENVSSYISYKSSEMTEWEFLREIATRADCGLLLDLNNIYVSSVNHGFDARHFIDGIPLGRVAQIHLAGHSEHKTASGRRYLIDTHDHPVCAEVWTLYRQAIERFGSVSTMIEWDDKIPEYSVIQNELNKARKIEATLHEDVERSKQSIRNSRSISESNQVQSI